MGNYSRTEEVKKLYNDAESVWPENDMWHKYTKKTIEQKLYEWVKTNSKDLILNAGSGGTVYKLNGTMFHLDIADNKIKDLPNSFVGSVDNIPFENNKFDIVICVGSVLNYVSLFPTLNELTRVLKPGGELILEYERSNSAGIWFTQSYGRNCVYKKYFYNKQEHGIWLYSEKFVKDILTAMGLNQKHIYRFHTVSSIMSRISSNMDKIIKVTSLDNLTQLLSFWSSHNCISVFTKAD